MKIALFGANGTIGQRILQESLARGHEVTAVVRDPSRFDRESENLQAVGGDVTEAASVAEAVKGHDAIISAVGPKLPDGDPQVLVAAAHALLDGAVQANVKRLIVVGGAGSLEVAPGVRLVDAPAFPAAWKGVALAHSDALDVYRNSQADVDWTYVSPPALIEPGERKGSYRVGGDQLIADEKGDSRISTEDYAAALLDEVERPHHLRGRFTVAY
jgi:uncharacterized protein